MSLGLWKRRCLAWIAVLAIGFGAVAPTLSQAALSAYSHAGGPWVQVCSASGLTWVRAEADNDTSGEHPAHAAMPCPWCVLHGGDANPPPAFELVLPEPPVIRPSALPAHQVRDLSPQGQPQPRAPPRTI